MGLTVETQQQTLWCWAAVSASVANYYHPGRHWTQCEVANLALGRADCCVDGSSSECNKEFVLRRALRHVGCFDGGILFSEGVFTFAQVKTLINKGRPPCPRQQWDTGAGHYVALVCWSEVSSRASEKFAPARQVLKVSDPLYGEAIVSYTTFATNYLGSGTWTNTDKTKP